MKIKYTNEIILNMELGDTTTYVYQTCFCENYNNGTKMIQYFIIFGLGLCIKLDSFVSHMFYTG